MLMWVPVSEADYWAIWGGWLIFATLASSSAKVTGNEDADDAGGVEGV